MRKARSVEEVTSGRDRLIPAIIVVIGVILVAAGVGGYLLQRQSASRTPTAQPAPASELTAQPAPPPPAAVPSATALSADIPGLAPFVGNWAGKRESVNIAADGRGRFHYADVQACQSCAMSDLSYTDMDFTVTSVSGNTAIGSVTADKYHQAGEPVDITLIPAKASGPPTISWTVSGEDEGLFCPATNSSWCGG